MNRTEDQKKLITFGQNLKMLRTMQKISQEELAEKTKLDRTYISGLERGIRNPSINNDFDTMKSYKKQSE